MTNGERLINGYKVIGREIKNFWSTISQWFDYNVNALNISLLKKMRSLDDLVAIFSLKQD